MRSSDYQMMLVDQNGKCAICGCPPPEKKRLCIDHDHKSGEVRSLLCGQCNTGIGLMRDSPDILRRAADYLEAGGHPSRFRVEGGRLFPFGD